MPLTPRLTPPEITTVAFDWGGTLMKEFAGQFGAMADWPQVEAVEDAREALEGLSQKYRLVVATNANESNEPQIRAALARVGLDAYFSEIFTKGRVNSRKPEKAYFQTMARMLNEDPGRIAMVGDDYLYDAAGSELAGLNGIWFNPACTPAPGLSLLPRQEIHDLRDVQAGIDGLRIPALGMCLAWLASQNVSANLLAHVQGVANVAYLLALWLAQAGEKVDVTLAQRGGLLHDVAKLMRVEGKHHGQLGEELLLEQGQSELASISRRHMLFGPQEGLPPKTWEQKVVYLADKLVEKNQLVTVEERLEALDRRYRIEDSQMKVILPYVLALQEEICSRVGFASNELHGRLNAAIK
jgi:putative hydrolase of the HAD superfamily